MSDGLNRQGFVAGAALPIWDGVYELDPRVMPKEDGPGRLRWERLGRQRKVRARVVFQESPRWVGAYQFPRRTRFQDPCGGPRSPQEPRSDTHPG